MAGCLEKVSVIIPLRDGEDSNPAMLEILQHEDADIILSSEGSRAESMNIGAAKSAKKFLWFLHSDTTLNSQSAAFLNASLQQNEESLHYFKLAFEGKALTQLNAIGANIRSKFLACPYGDQGLCIRKDLFFKLGGYDESAAYGEDHLLVWRARRHGIKLKQINEALITSPRAYEGRWLRLTMLRQWFWLKQAIPQWFLLIQGK